MPLRSATRALICSALTLFGAAASEAQPSAGNPPRRAEAAGQEPGATNLTRLMLGADVKQTLMPGDGTANRLGLGFAWRWRSRTPRTEDGLAFAWRLASYSTELRVPVMGRELAVGSLRIRPLLVGAEYRMPRGKWTWSAGATGGIGFNGLHTPDDLRAGLATVVGSEVHADVRNSLVISPRVKGWYDVNRRVSFVMEASYSFARPELTVRSGQGDFSRRFNADALILKAGVLYGVW